MAELLSDLRSPPVVGRRYLVPCVEYLFCGRRDVWPTFGPLHHDRGVVGFDRVHLHIDPRFVTGEQARFSAATNGRLKAWQLDQEKAA